MSVRSQPFQPAAFFLILAWRPGFREPRRPAGVVGHVVRLRWPAMASGCGGRPIIPRRPWSALLWAAANPRGPGAADDEVVAVQEAAGAVAVQERVERG